MSRHPGRRFAKRPSGRSQGERGLCPSGKTTYRNRAAAIAGRSRVISDWQAKDPERVPDLFVYRCRVRECRAWHLTSQDPAAYVPPADREPPTP